MLAMLYIIINKSRSQKISKKQRQPENHQTPFLACPSHYNPPLHKQHPNTPAMPELPEVETTLRGIAPHILRQTVSAVTIRQPKLRWQIPPALPETLRGLVVRECRRRAKYLLIRFDTGVPLVHLVCRAASSSLHQTACVPSGTHPTCELQRV